MTTVAFVDLAAQDAPVKDALRDAALGVMDRGDYILGAAIGEFEEAFADYCGSRRAVGVASGLAALELILRGYGIGAGDEVIVPAHTFVATAGAVAMTGARPVLVDVGEDYTMDPARVEEAIGPATRAIIGVHLYGRAFDAVALREIAERHGVVLIEDAAQAHGATHRGRTTGTLGHAAAFSFYPTKNLGASGDAGMVTTDDADLARRIRALANCGQFVKNEHALMPFNHRMDTLQAAVLSVRLTRLNAWNGARRRAAAAYRQALADLPIVLPPDDDAERCSVYHLFVIRSDRRGALAAPLKSAGIATAIHYPIPVHLHEVFRDLGYREGDFPVAESNAKSILSLPMHPNLDDDQIEHVANGIRSFFDAG